jgi:PAS domain S-box-containing protein
MAVVAGASGQMAKGRVQSNYSHSNSVLKAGANSRDVAVSDVAELELIYKTAPIGLAFLSPDCRYIMINERLTEICGIPAGDHIGRLVRDTVPQVAEQVEQIVQTILRTGEPIIGVEVNGQKPDGSNVDRVWITNWHPLKGRHGDIIGVNVAAQEITERKRAEFELARSQEQLRSLNNTLAERAETNSQERDRLWNLSQDLLVVSDLTGGVVNVNPAWSSVLGWAPQDLIGKTGEWLVHPADRERSLAERVSLVAGQQTRHFENRIRCKDGSYRWLSWSAVADRGVIYATGRDVTDRKQAREQLHNLRRQLADASRQTAIDTLAASIVHEIRQPLTAIVSNANAGLRWLKNSGPKIDEACSALDRIVKAGHRLDEVIVDLRAMFGKESRETSLVDVRLLVTDVLALAQSELENHQIALRNDIPARLPKIMVARVQLQQVVLNLIMNAAEAMSSVNERDRCLTIASSMDGEASITITIEDTGCGIDPAHLDHIFDPFFSTKTSGMGLGLAISRSIVEAHGGRLSASQCSPFGTAFHLTLPVSPAGAGNLKDRGVLPANSAR